MIKIDAGDFFLVEPCEEYAEQIAEYKQACLDADSSMDGCGPLRKNENSTAYIAECKKYTKPETLPKGLVLATQFFYIRKADNCLVGMIQVRHYFNDYLKNFGGNIGYSIRPCERRKGYAKQMLKMALPICRELGLTKLLLTCDESNITSERTILANGGVYESTVSTPSDNKAIKRFWIIL